MASRLAQDLPRRPLLPRPHLLADVVAKHRHHFISKPLRVCDAHYHRANSRYAIYVDVDPHQTW